MNEVTRILPHDEFLEGDKTIEPIGDYGDPVKITEEEVNEIDKYYFNQVKDAYNGILKIILRH